MKINITKSQESISDSPIKIPSPHRSKFNKVIKNRRGNDIGIFKSLKYVPLRSPINTSESQREKLSQESYTSPNISEYTEFEDHEEDGKINIKPIYHKKEKLKH